MENVFNVRYNEEKDKLEILPNKNKTAILNGIRKHKFISIILMCFFALSIINFYLIYSFMKILENI